MAHEKWQAATYPKLGHPWTSDSKARIHGDIAHLRGVSVFFPNRHGHWRTGAQNTRGELRGRRRWGQFWSKRGKIVQKVVPPKIVSLVPYAWN